MQGFIFNIRRLHLQDRRVREALGLLFDYEWTNRQLFNGAYTRTRSYFDNSELASSGLPSEDERKILERCAARCRTRYSTRLSNCHKPRATA